MRWTPLRFRPALFPIVRALELIPADGLLEAFLLAKYNIQATGHVAKLRRHIDV